MARAVPQRDMQNGAALRVVDFFAPEHPFGGLRDSGLPGEFYEQFEGAQREAVFGEVEQQSGELP